MHLEAIAAVFDDIGIDKARNDAFAKKCVAKTLGQQGREISRVGFGRRFQGELMLAGVGVQVGWLDCIEVEQLTMAEPEKEAENCASYGRNKEQAARFGHGDKSHNHKSQNNEEADRMARPLPGAVRSKGHEVSWLGIGGVFSGSDH